MEREWMEQREFWGFDATLGKWKQPQKTWIGIHSPAPKMEFHWLITATFPCWKRIEDHVPGAPCPAVIPRVLPFPGADPALRVIYGCFRTSLWNLVKASVEMGRALQISIWILLLLSRKERQEKGEEEPGMLREGLMFPKG